MHDGNTAVVTQKGFFKGLISCSDPDPPLDEEGNPIIPNKKELTSFQLIKKMLRLKAKQEARPEYDPSFTPNCHPEFLSDGKDQYYFDMKGNEEHYQMLTNDMTDKEFHKFEEREKLRADARHHERKLMKKFVDCHFEEQRKIAVAKEKARNQRVDIKKMGQFVPETEMIGRKSKFNDDDELI